MATGFQVKTHACCAPEAVRRLKMTFSWRSDSTIFGGYCALRENRRQLLRRFDSQQFVDIHAPMNHLDSGGIDTKRLRQKNHHVVSGAAKLRGGSDTDFQLGTLGFADGIYLGVGFSQYVYNQCVTVPSEKRCFGWGDVLHILDLTAMTS